MVLQMSYWRLSRYGLSDLMNDAYHLVFIHCLHVDRLEITTRERAAVIGTG